MSNIDASKQGVDAVVECIKNAEEDVPCRFYMDGCPHCVAMDDAWNELPSKCGRDCVDIEARVIDDVKEKLPTLADSKGGFPQVILLKAGTGELVREHNGERNVDALVDFVMGGQSGGARRRRYATRKHKRSQRKHKRSQRKHKRSQRKHKRSERKHKRSQRKHKRSQRKHKRTTRK
jgi:hypothetical protein